MWAGVCDGGAVSGTAQIDFLTTGSSYMWPFNKKQKTQGALAHPRYAKQPINLLFESMVLDVIGHLPDSKRQTLKSMNLQKVFNTGASEWREVLRETLHLSDTIEIAILDLWLRKRETGIKQGIVYDPVAFSQDFTDNYFADDSQVDVWPPGALEAARKRITEYGETDRTRNEM